MLVDGAACRGEGGGPSLHHSRWGQACWWTGQHAGGRGGAFIAPQQVGTGMLGGVFNAPHKVRAGMQACGP